MTSTSEYKPHTEVVTGTIERVTFHSEETGFTVVRVKAKGYRDLVTVVGAMPSVTAGEWLEAEGIWTVDREHGRQLKADRIRSARPDTLEGMERYLGSGLIKGIGPHFAAKLVAAFGKDVFDVIEQNPERLTEITGVGAKRRSLITSAWSEQKAVREIMVFLHSHGVGSSRAFRIYKTYGDAAIDTVRENPYRLAHDIWGIGFKTADQIAASLGVPRESDIRARAGVEYVLAKLTEEGHSAYPRDDLTAEAVKMLEIGEATVRAAIDYGLGEGKLVSRRHEERDLLFLASLDASEEGLAKSLASLASAPHPCPAVDIAKAVEWVEEKTGLTFAETQRQAIGEAVENKVFIITGGPGTGKTTLVNAIVKILAAKGLDIVLCAPTGRAAKRMSETSGREAKTIHRLLEFDPATGGFKRKQDNPLEGDVFVVDEASMLDVALAYQLVRAIPRHAALMFVGDVDQLPSVGPGTVLADLIDSGRFAVCRLTEIFRQAAKSMIVTNAHRVNRGIYPEYPRHRVDNPRECDFYFIEAEEPEDAAGKIVHLMATRLRDSFGIDPMRDVQVLSPMQRGVLGARNLNLELQKTLNPSAKGIQRYGYTFRVGDKVMQTQNDYDKDVYNGDIGVIRALDDEEREALVAFDGRDVAYQYDEFDELSLSYAVTIHKSQGSEYPCVVIPVHMQHYTMLQRNLVYTGITRGKRLVILVGGPKALAMAVKRVNSRARISALKARLREIPS